MILFTCVVVVAGLGLVSGEETHHHDNEHHHYERVHVNNDNEHHKQLYMQNHQHHQNPSTNSRVLELSDRFLDIVNTPLPPPPGTTQIGPNAEPRYQPWLVKFYAPWCGHCKRLEPVFNHVAQALHNTAIRVGRVDCTRFPSVGTEFKIHGYPTIMFISGPNRKHTFQGDRTLDQIVKFAKRMNSPPIQTPSVPLRKFLESLQKTTPPPSRTKRSEDEKEHQPHTPDLLFGLLCPKSLQTDVTQAFKQVSQKYQQHNEFFEFNNEQTSTPQIFAYKNGRIILYEQEEDQNVTSDVERWVGNERFPDFMHLTRGNIHQVFHEGANGGYNVKDLIITAVVEEDKLERILSDRENELLQLLRSVTNNAVQNTLIDHPNVALDVSVPVTTLPVPHHFGWIGSPDLANSIVAEHLTLPTLLIVARSHGDNNHKYYVFSDWQQIDSESKIENIIELVKEGHFTPTVYANSWSFKMYRYLFDAKVSLTDMWVGNPVLTVVLFGLPAGFLSLILYSVCCGDILDARDETAEDLLPEDSDEEHEKRE